MEGDEVDDTFMRQASAHVAMLVEDHLRLDEAIGFQLKLVVGDSEASGMSLIMQARRISDAAAALLDYVANAGLLAPGLEHGHDALSQYRSAVHAAVTEHNNKLATEIAEILGQIQGQDVLRQRIERAVLAVVQRNGVLRELPRALAECGADLAGLPAQMKVVLDDYQVNEAVHAPAATEASGQSEGQSKYELF